MFRSPYADALIALVIVLLFLGPKRLPGLGRSLGEGMREFKDGITGGSKDSSSERPPAAISAGQPRAQPPQPFAQQPAQPVAQPPQPAAQPAQPVAQPPAQPATAPAGGQPPASPQPPQAPQPPTPAGTNTPPPPADQAAGPAPSPDRAPREVGSEQRY